ncbi:MAG: ROK family protein [Gemmiger sp.]|nr:ROK family protein [Gemmiger sp.]
MKNQYTIGIDLGGTTMTAGLVNDQYEIVGKITWATRLPRPAEDLEKALAELCRAVARENNVAFEDIHYVGIGTPGTVNFTTGMVGYNTNFNYYDWNLGPDLTKLLGCKVYVENDANAAAYGEYIAGGAKGCKDAVVITLGTGIGSGIILNGKILRGFNFAAGEMGHTVIVKGGRACNCGRNGCWERYASARALSEDTREAMKQHADSVMWKIAGDLEHVNAKTVFDAQEQGDAAAKAVLDNWLEYVGCGIANVVMTFEPEIVCIGGGVSNQGETILAPVRAYVERETHNVTTGINPQIKACVLRNDAGVIGAAVLENSI